ncbi:uncharacterized protein EV154DRAFT_482175 [Mucor mucedo]|uniref:uncharacterized protein n=1 Tax=Mucor mucedo TaxID=29922 RepID=UPI0022208383|nr:uncharacterized protein EV154DRAFT_482175 [Mucor mucedo]KAI7890450.1 hypothetical protein EV154DRAFT_482175 [Mucor mucedo]
MAKQNLPLTVVRPKNVRDAFYSSKIRKNPSDLSSKDSKNMQEFFPTMTKNIHKKSTFISDYLFALFLDFESSDSPSEISWSDTAADSVAEIRNMLRNSTTCCGKTQHDSSVFDLVSHRQQILLSSVDEALLFIKELSLRYSEKRRKDLNMTDPELHEKMAKLENYRCKQYI